jgi:tetratricopeptide (TPR) repeat protein
MSNIVRPTAESPLSAHGDTRRKLRHTPLIWPPYAVEAIVRGIVSDRDAAHIRADYGASVPWRRPTSPSVGAAPGLHILVTSREALGVTAEHRIELTGLDLDAPALRSTAPAAALFTERARRRVATFEPDEHVDHICALVGGLPLAIELAARWTSSMTTSQIADRLANDVGLLETDAPDVPHRQRTMAGVLEATWSRLDPAQARLASCLSVFVGGFDLDAAHAVCGAAPLDLQRLVGRSLLSWLPGGRLEMHELIRQHALTFLDDHQTGTLRAAHRTHYLDRIIEGYPTFIGPDPAAFIAWLDADFDNVVMAWDAAIEADDTTALAAASETLSEFSVATGREIEVGELFDRAAPLGPDVFTATMYARRIRVSWHRARAADIERLFASAQALVPGSSPEEANVRIQLAYDFGRHLTENTGENERCAQLTRSARADADALGDPRHHAALDVTDARTAMMAGRFDEALGDYTRAIEVLTDVGDAMRASDCVAMTAAAHAEQYHVWEALQADLAALDLRLRRKDVRAMSLAEMNTGASYALVATWDEDERHTLRSLELLGNYADDTFPPCLDCQMAEIRVGQGRRAEAEALFTRGIDRLRHFHYTLGLRLKLPEWARFLIDEARWLEADVVIDEARELWEQASGGHFLTLLDGLAARVAAGEGDSDRAVQLARSAWDRIRETDGTGHPFPIRTLADCVMALDPAPDTSELIAEIVEFAR